MKQILQSFKTGVTEVVDVPRPKVKDGCLLIQSQRSLVSSGTERMLLDFSKSSLLSKAKKQPENVKRVLDKIKTDGIIETFDTVNTKLGQPIPLGYSNVGIVKEVGSGVSQFNIGDRVVSNGHHSEYICVPKNLCAKIPDTVENDLAVFTVPAAIALQGIRLVKPTLGETVFVMGLGLIGLLTVQILKAYGCRVIASDFDSKKISIAKNYGIDVCDLSKGEDPVQLAMYNSDLNGVDAVIITAATNSNDLIHEAATMCRKRGRIILVGVVGLNLNREDFYEKELIFQVSCSYGPGRYDQNYERNGQDYPIGFVRWTENRNFQSVLHLMKENKIHTDNLITHRYKFNDAEQGYNTLMNNKDVIGIVFDYHSQAYEIKDNIINNTNIENVSFEPSLPIIGCIGAGNFAMQSLFPNLKSLSLQLNTIVDNGPLKSKYAAKKFGFKNFGVDYKDILEDQNINTVFITTRHDTHAKLVIEFLKSGKNVFVEKPLALTLKELDDIESAILNNKSSILMVGFNRRFSPQIKKMKTLISVSNNPKSFIITVNSGVVPPEHWTQNMKIGGGRIIGEACHFIDLMLFLSGSEIKSWSISSIQNDGKKDIASINLTFDSGSIGTIHYLSNGSKDFPKERVEVFFDGKVIQLDNFRQMKGFGTKNFRKMNLFRQDKGHKMIVSSFIQAIKNGDSSPIPPDQLIAISKAAINISKEL